MCLCGLRLKKHIIFHILYIIVAPLCLCLSETRRFLQSSSFWEARRALIGQLSGAFVIGETTNNKHYSTLLKTDVWIVSGKFFKYENVLTGCEWESPDCPCDVGIAPLYRNSLCASQQARLLSCQVQEIVLRKMRCTHSNIWVELFWNSVVNTT